ncbi:predicted protein [Aspergillus terreus NIH2624]|uniref:Uncharacterized protein n=1 Tax=Aspergillus terreus (strain NIH 2624 / FGSC A1156) TaxID=341663 RepID=Q0CCA7_ASPTN|nr:uncharacterized protein ATEG_08677 [Aspergillus terreus NIH2624]EAU30809.1 predicted protein [Aspergillus terreus NIH2624]
MHFSEIITSTLLFSLSSVAVAAPSPTPLEGRIAELERRTEKMVARAGWTCAFGGNEACQVNVHVEDVPRGFDIADDVFSALLRDMLVDTVPVMMDMGVGRQRGPDEEIQGGVLIVILSLLLFCS